jgi:hypothetical protein
MEIIWNMDLQPSLQMNFRLHCTCKLYVHITFKEALPTLGRTCMNNILLMWRTESGIHQSGFSCSREQTSWQLMINPNSLSPGWPHSSHIVVEVVLGRARHPRLQSLWGWGGLSEFTEGRVHVRPEYSTPNYACGRPQWHPNNKIRGIWADYFEKLQPQTFWKQSRSFPFS